MSVSKEQYMKSIDIDKTIVELLKTYQVYLKLLIEDEKARVFNFPYKNALDREAAEQEFLDIQRAYDLFKLILENPKKYLYRSEDIIFTGLDNRNEPCRLLDSHQTISDKFMPLYNLINQHGGPHVLHMLSSYIVFHINEQGGKQKPWIYNPRSDLYDGQSDFYAGAILRLNKMVSLMGKSAIAKHFKEFLPARMFAVKVK
jgi:hypothetical protein